MRELENIYVNSFLGIAVIAIFSTIFLLICVFVIKNELTKYGYRYSDKYSSILER